MSHNIQIRQARKQDKEAIVSLIKSCLPYDERFAVRYYNSYFSDDPTTEEDQVFVARTGNKIVGVIGYCEDSSDYACHLSWFVVDRRYQGWRNGIVADKLLKAIEDDLRRYGAGKLFVSAGDKSDRGHGFYLKNGFQFEARLRDYYGMGEDQIIFGKEL